MLNGFNLLCFHEHRWLTECHRVISPEQQIAFKNLVRRNQASEAATKSRPPPGSIIQLPFIILNTDVRTVIDCSISSDKYDPLMITFFLFILAEICYTICWIFHFRCEYLFNFDNMFEIHDDIEVLKRMGLSLGLENGKCTSENLSVAKSLVPKSLESYVTGGLFM